jgi:hypothetical protein
MSESTDREKLTRARENIVFTANRIIYITNELEFLLNTVRRTEEFQTKANERRKKLFFVVLNFLAVEAQETGSKTVEDVVNGIFPGSDNEMYGVWCQDVEIVLRSAVEQGKAVIENPEEEDEYEYRYTTENWELKDYTPQNKRRYAHNYSRAFNQPSYSRQSNQVFCES